MTRLMLHRPPTHDHAAGLERFACLDIPATLTRSTCARRYTLALGIHPTVKGEHTAQTREARACVVCVACPVGAVHAAEAGTAVQGGRMRLQPTKSRGDCLPREMRDVPAPPAVVPPKHKTADPMGRDAPPPRHWQGPVEIEIPIPPSGETVSTGQRPIITCAECLRPFTPRWHREARCKPCRDRLGLARYAGPERRAASQAVTIERARAARALARVAAASGASDVPATSYRRGGRLITVAGVTLSVLGWARRNGWTATVISNRLRGGWDPVRAVTEPPDPKCRNTRRVADAAE